ncbi:MAG: serine hydrolase [Thermoleophilia bacterium]
MAAHALPPPPPALIAPDVVYGRAGARIGPRTRRLLILTDGRVRRALRVRPGPRRVTVPLPVGRWSVRLVAMGDGGRRASAARVVWVLPRNAAILGTTRGRLDRRLQGDLEAMAGRAPFTVGVYAQHLRTGCGAAVNAGAPFPTASVLKAGILLDAVRRPRDADDGVLDRMILDSDDRAANDVLARQGGGDGVAGAASVTQTLRDIGLPTALVRRPYIIDDTATERSRPIPVTATSQPALYTNFIGTPAELALMFVLVHRAALGGGALHRVGIGPIAARDRLMRRFLEVHDTGKLVAGVPAGTPVAHKTGYNTDVKADVGVIYTAGGPVVVAAMTWSAAGVGDAAGDTFIADVARAALARLGHGGRC